MRRALTTLTLVLAVLAATSVTPRGVQAQVTAADSAAVLLEAAQAFVRQGDPQVGQAILRYIVSRFPGTAAAQAAQERLASVQARGTAGSGRVELRVWSTLYGGWLGLAIPAALGVDDPEPYGLGLLVGGPAGFLAGRMIAGSRDITEGQARAITLGGTWGSWQGLGWAQVLDLGGESICVEDVYYGGYCYETDADTEEKFAAMIVGGLAGIAVGSVLSRKDISPGVATAANFGALWGTWLGFGAAYVGGVEGDDALFASALVGGNVGLLGAAALAPGWNVSRSRARLVSIYGVIGGLAGLGLDLLVQPDDERVAVGIPLAGSVVGLAVGAGSTSDYDAPVPGGGSGPGYGAMSGALLNLADGGWSVAAPIPTPRVVDLALPGATVRKATLGIPLFRARF